MNTGTLASLIDSETGFRILVRTSVSTLCVQGWNFSLRTRSFSGMQNHPASHYNHPIVSLNQSPILFCFLGFALQGRFKIQDNKYISWISYKEQISWHIFHSDNVICIGSSQSWEIVFSITGFAFPLYKMSELFPHCLRIRATDDTTI